MGFSGLDGVIGFPFSSYSIMFGSVSGTFPPPIVVSAASSAGFSGSSSFFCCLGVTVSSTQVLTVLVIVPLIHSRTFQSHATLDSQKLTLAPSPGISAEISSRSIM